MSLQRRYADTDLSPEFIALFDTFMDGILPQAEELPTQATRTVKRLAKIGMKSESFAAEALQKARVHQELMPRALDLERFARALRNRDAIKARLIRAEALAARLRTLLVLLVVDTYSDALDVYHSLKRHGTMQHVQESVRELAKIFRRSRRSEEDEQAGKTRGREEEIAASAESANEAPLAPEPSCAEGLQRSSAIGTPAVSPLGRSSVSPAKNPRGEASALTPPAGKNYSRVVSELLCPATDQLPAAKLEGSRSRGVKRRGALRRFGHLVRLSPPDAAQISRKS